MHYTATANSGEAVSSPNRSFESVSVNLRDTARLYGHSRGESSTGAMSKLLENLNTNLTALSLIGTGYAGFQWYHGGGIVWHSWWVSVDIYSWPEFGRHGCTDGNRGFVPGGRTSSARFSFSFAYRSTVLVGVVDLALIARSGGIIFMTGVLIRGIERSIRTWLLTKHSVSKDMHKVLLDILRKR
jgi:hypothetical protein